MTLFWSKLKFLVDAMVDVLILETHTNLKELVQGVKAAKEYCSTFAINCLNDLFA